MTNRVLLVDDDRAVRDALGQTLELADLRPTLAASFIEAKDHISRDFDGVTVTDLRMPGKDGFHLLEYAQSIDPDLPVILLTGEGDIPMAVRGMSAGAFDFLEKPCAPNDLIATIRKALQNRALVLENRQLKKSVEAGDAASRLLFGNSALADELRANARAAGRLKAEVLVSGPPGSGAVRVAEAIHKLSGAAEQPFVKCAGAALDVAGLAGWWHQAEGGTLFIDEITALDPATQYALLEKLETADRTVRVIAGTSVATADLMNNQALNIDLYYKIDVMRVRIPALSERPEDIPILFRQYLEQACEQSALPVPEITAELTAGLMAMDWPGNTRSLMNAAMRYGLGFADPIGAAQSGMGLGDQMDQVERVLLISALERLNGNASEAARDLKLPRKTFYDKLARHGIRPGFYRA